MDYHQHAKAGEFDFPSRVFRRRPGITAGVSVLNNGNVRFELVTCMSGGPEL